MIVNFFASWCGPCQRETPLLAWFYRASADRVVIIGVDADDSAPAARRFVTSERVRYPVGSESAPGVADAYGVSAAGIPETFFLDARHRIVKRILGDVTAQELSAGTALMDSHRTALGGYGRRRRHPESRLTTVQSPPRVDPPYVPIRRSAWPARRTPRLLFAVVAVLLAIATAVALVQRPSTAQRASDLRGFMHDMTSDIESCAGGVGESLTALHGIESGSSHQVADAIGVAQYGASNCSPANSMQIDDLTSYQVAESLASFHLASVVEGLVNWASPDAVKV